VRSPRIYLKGSDDARDDLKGVEEPGWRDCSTRPPTPPGPSETFKELAITKRRLVGVRCISRDSSSLRTAMLWLSLVEGRVGETIEAGREFVRPPLELVWRGVGDPSNAEARHRLLQFTISQRTTVEMRFTVAPSS
jgi:hypothetical protein